MLCNQNDKIKAIVFVKKPSKYLVKKYVDYGANYIMMQRALKKGDYTKPVL